MARGAVRLLLVLCVTGLVYYQYTKWLEQVVRNTRPSTDTISPWTAHYRKPKAPSKDERGCPYYHEYSQSRHGPLSSGPLELAFQRPTKECRTFTCEHVEEFIESVCSHIRDADLARLFENNFPNTLDTTVRWRQGGKSPRAFIITGDINAEWLRDSSNQLLPYVPLLSKSAALRELFRGAILTQAEFVTKSPYCNAFQAPTASKISPISRTTKDDVVPKYEPDFVFECKYELDSLASFIKLSRVYWQATGDAEWVSADNGLWIRAVDTVLQVLDQQSMSTFDSVTKKPRPALYQFRRHTNIGSETLSSGGAGNPVNDGTGLVRSAFRPSDDATIFQLLIPANAFISVELAHLSSLLSSIQDGNGESHISTLASRAVVKSQVIREAIFQHAVFDHKVYGKVFAYEIDGYGSATFMDDANLPSLLSLPMLEFVQASDPVYQNTRRMILSHHGNPYFFTGSQHTGIGSIHVNLRAAWPMSSIVRCLTSTNQTEVAEQLQMLKHSTAGLGLMHEAVNVDAIDEYTRSWFAWCGSLFGQAILDIRDRYPSLL